MWAWILQQHSGNRASRAFAKINNGSKMYNNIHIYKFLIDRQTAMHSTSSSYVISFHVCSDAPKCLICTYKDLYEQTHFLCEHAAKCPTRHQTLFHHKTHRLVQQITVAEAAVSTWITNVPIKGTAMTCDASYFLILRSILNDREFGLHTLCELSFCIAAFN